MDLKRHVQVNFCISNSCTSLESLFHQYSDWCSPQMFIPGKGFTCCSHDSVFVSLDHILGISRNFRNERQEDAHEYMVNLLESMHKCCLPSGVPSESPAAYETSLVHKIFGGSLRSQVNFYCFMVDSLTFFWGMKSSCGSSSVNKCVHGWVVKMLN